MTAIENRADRTGLAAARTTKNPRSTRKRGILLGAAGFMIPFIAGLPFVVNGVIPVTWGEWLFALSAVLAVWGLLWCILLLGWDTRLRFGFSAALDERRRLAWTGLRAAIIGASFRVWYRKRARSLERCVFDATTIIR